MKKIIIATLILTLALIIFPLGSFAKNNNGKGATVIKYEAVPPNYIEDLVFDFGDGLPLDLPGFEDPVIVQCAIVIAPGREILVITPSGQYNYDAKLDAGIIYATTIDHDIQICSALLEEDPDDLINIADIVMPFDSASLNEHFSVDDPEIVDLFFKVKNAAFIGPDGNIIGDPFNIMLKLKDSYPQIIKFKF